ncbi:MAG: sulfonate ABC transporter permease, partial [Alphaproteobacteria bacterium]|nr:sulfonate ABC transporter permease [Alphaproteobacteria bacterium]
MPDTHPAATLWSRRALPNRWDILALVLILGGAALLALGMRHAAVPVAALDAMPVTLDPANLPGYALRTTLRMLAAMAASLLFTLAYAPLAARTRAGVVLLPLLDVLQSVPILGFLSFTVTAFVGLFPGSTLGYECAAVFAIFTSQAWNMAFSFHQSLRSVPPDL